MTQLPILEQQRAHYAGVRSHAAAKLMARRLQQQGYTLSEIAEKLDCRREAMVNLLYWEVVRDA